VKKQAAALAIIGAGGHGLVVAEAAELLGDWSDIHFFDDASGVIHQAETWPVIGRVSLLLEQLKLGSTHPLNVLVAVGHNATRAAITASLAQHGASFATVVHPRAYVSPSASIGAGSVVMAGAIVNSRSQLGEGCIVNVGAVVDHDVKVDAFVHLAPGCVVAGGCHIGRMAWLGTGSRMAPGNRVAEETVLTAGAVIG
jgi:sugar O-acyltransferase (sialic acid O-acetyltransferase NeuD family)